MTLRGHGGISLHSIKRFQRREKMYTFGVLGFNAKGTKGCAKGAEFGIHYILIIQ